MWANLRKQLWCPRQFTAVGMKYFAPQKKSDYVEKVERPKLKVMERVPQYPPNLRPPKMQKKLKFMRGPEVVHNNFIHKQYGIVAESGGRLRWGHFEMLRLTIGRKMDVNRMFAIWRVPPPWQPVTKKGQGQRMGGGKGAIDYYVTPIKKGRVILEVAGNCEFSEVKSFLDIVAQQLPFKARVISHDLLTDLEHSTIEDPSHSYIKYIIQNNLSGCHKWLSPVDHKWFGKYN
ncbi:39S ribosomal protein L16, mitochondrial [Bactrocera neohumeralis]|uniref:39S ribosomal protein L16, mitochondrial n=1 Tax=Bactrocera tryoni TaxID=59916 RepID=UPI001A99F966|nr:39S ribosomal protein L16, mitochondrial [Bactrocera tryoni]XP_050332538.1 39S ribosomal protein L16, mitochondrial [Bactrocera neohumeralis]